MKHVGSILKDYLETNRIKKTEVAAKAGITYNYLSTIFKQETCKVDLLEKLCIASGLHPSAFFDIAYDAPGAYSGNSAQTIIGDASVSIGTCAHLQELIKEKERIIAEKERIIEEKERTIQLLMESRAQAISGTQSGQI